MLGFRYAPPAVPAYVPSMYSPVCPEPSPEHTLLCVYIGGLLSLSQALQNELTPPSPGNSSIIHTATAGATQMFKAAPYQVCGLTTLHTALCPLSTSYYI